MKTGQAPDAEFVSSCPRVELSPRPPLPEIAFAGRSNVGKSSLINSLLNRKQLAQTSKTPGKTRLMNYYRIDNGKFYFVDLPGYGYAEVPGAMKREWGDAIESYLRDGPRIALVVQLIDSRREPTNLDLQMADALRIYRRPWVAMLTKIDKLNATERRRSISVAENVLIPLGAAAVKPFSAVTHEGHAELWNEIYTALKR